MANSAQAAKRARQAEKARSQNASLRSQYRTAVKNVLKALHAKDKKAATESYKKAVPVLDSMVNKHIIHQNKASRHKSRLNQQIKLLG